jgi:hypothetical protein
MDMTVGIQIRKDVLLSALYLEGFVSYFLAGLLNVKDVENSYSFGHTSKSLSFNQKVNLLIDIGALNKADQNKFITFMEIRNQFMHNLNAKTYELCLSYLAGRDKFLLKTYPQNSSIAREKQLEGAVSDPTNDVMKLTISVVDKIKDKAGQDAKADIYKDLLEILESSIAESAKTFDKIFEDMIKKGDTISTKSLRGMGKMISGVIFHAAKKKLNEAK